MTFYFPSSHIEAWILTAFATAVVQALFHELGHLSFSRFYGLNKSKIVAIYKPFWWTKYPVLAVFNDPVQIFSITRKRRKVIAAAGCGFDLLMFVAVFFILSRVQFHSIVEFGIKFATLLRMITFPLNIYPIASIENDGWRYLNPDQRN